jgi:hypothetical protein
MPASAGEENYKKKGTAMAVPFTFIVAGYGLQAKPCGAIYA